MFRLSLLTENRKLRHLSPFEFFDHSVLQKHTDKEFIMN